MSMQWRNLIYPLMAPPESTAGVADTKSEMSKDDILDYLNKDDDDDKDVIPLDDKDDKEDKKDDKKATKAETEDDETADKDSEEDKEEDEKDELKELENELEDPDEEKLELTTPTSRREILKKYPKLFKDFPYLETAYYREQEFTKILPTIKDAKEAVEKSNTLDKFEQDLTSGNTETILKSVKENNPKAFNKIVDEYLTTLSKVDEKSYHHVLGNTIKHTILAMIQESRSSNNEILEQAAQILNQFVFGSSKFTNPTRLVNDGEEDNSAAKIKEKEIEEREKSFAKRRFTEVNESLSTKINKAYKSTIEAKIDPKDSMSEYVKKTATREALEELESLIDKDTRFKVLVDKLWERAFKDDFSQESIGRIRSAFVSKAQTLLPSVIQKARIAALKGMGKRVREDDDSHQSKESNNGRESSRKQDSNKGEESHRRNDSSSRNKVPSGMSTLDYLMSDD